MDNPKLIDYASAFLKLNIGGKRYKMLKSTATRYHSSLFAELAGLNERRAMGAMGTSPGPTSPQAASCFYLIDTDEFYLERSSVVFDYVLEYAYSGALHCPNGVCRKMLIQELQFWRLVTEENEETVRVEECCKDGQKEEEKGEEEGEGEDRTEHRRTVMGKIWQCCEEPGSSVPAGILNIVSIFFILLSIVNLLLSTVKSLHHCKEQSNGNNVTEDDNAPDDQTNRCEGGPIFDLMEAICIGWFTLELVVRFVACPNKGRFFKSILNIIDILSTIPFYIELILWALNVNTGKLLFVYVLRLLRILRIFRALRLARYFDSIRIMGETLKKCKNDLSILLVLIFMAMIISSTIIYYFERDEQDTPFTSIPMSFWWCIVTLTTVGYGDVTPSTSGGKVTAGVVCVVGIILLAMPISIMVEQFSQTYKTRRTKTKRADVGELVKRVSEAAKGGGTSEQAKLINQPSPSSYRYVSRTRETS